MLAVIKGAGDLATGIAQRLRLANIKVAMTDIEKPSAIRRTAAFSEAIYNGTASVEGFTAVKANNAEHAERILAEGNVPVLIDPTGEEALKLNPDVPADFIMVYSGLDTFDVAYKWGIDACLDGMLSCTPYCTGKLFEAMSAGDWDAAAEYLDKITDLRDFFVAHDLWPSFSTAMNLLGYEGNFCPDYVNPINPEYIPLIREELVKMGETVV